MGFWLFVGGSVGSVSGVEIIHWLNRFGPANYVIRVLYLVMLGAIGSIMLVDSARTWRSGAFMSERRFEPIRARTWVDSLPFKVHFPTSDIQVPSCSPVAFGALAGVLAAMMGVGGGFIMIPLMLYVLRMRIHVAAGTSLFQILCTLHARYRAPMRAEPYGGLRSRLPARHGLDGRGGGRDETGGRLRADQLKVLLAVIILVVACQVGIDLFKTPTTFLSHVAGE